MIYEFDRYAVVGRGPKVLMAEGAKVLASSPDEAMRRARALFDASATLVPRDGSHDAVKAGIDAA